MDANEIIDVVLGAWRDIFDSQIGAKRFKIGRDFFPRPQMMGFLLEQLIALDLAARHPNHWRAEKSSVDKDLVYIPNAALSVEIKTSSNPRRIFANRSYAQPSTASKKTRSGYFLAVNFEKFSGTAALQPKIVLVRFGWLDHTDWIGQKAATGQQARLKPQVERLKLQTLYSNK